MHTDRLVIVGAGGHALVVRDAARLSGRFAGGISVCSQDRAQVGQALDGVPILDFDDVDFDGACFHVAIGANAVRKRLVEALLARGGKPASIVHPAAIIAEGAEIGMVAFVAARAVVAPAVVIGQGVIVNHGAIIDHEVAIDPFSHIAPGATLAGAVRIGAGVLVGAGANILPRVAIGEGATIGAGAVVLGDVPAGRTFVGVPARALSKG